MPSQEVKRIMTLAKGDAQKAYAIVESQLSVLVIRTQVMLSLSGIVVTVTGFSGRTIAQTSETARALIAAGIITVLCAAAIAIMGVLMLAAAQGMQVKIRCTGDKAQACLDEIAALIANRFGEPR